MCYTVGMKKTIVEFGGIQAAGPDVARAGAEVSWDTAYKRIKRGWSVADAFTAPAHTKPVLKGAEAIAKLQGEIAALEKKLGARRADLARLQADPSYEQLKDPQI